MPHFFVVANKSCAHEFQKRLCRYAVQACTGLPVTVTQRFYYSAYPVLGCYTQFPLLDISRYWLLHNVSCTRRFQWKALLIFLLKHSIARHFNYSTFQCSRLVWVILQVRGTRICPNLQTVIFIHMLYAREKKMRYSQFWTTFSFLKR